MTEEIDLQPVVDLVTRDRDLTAQVRAIRVERGEDSSGQPAAWFWVILSDAAAAGPSELRTLIRERLEAEVEARFSDLWPYVRFRSESEQAAVDSGRDQPALR